MRKYIHTLEAKFIALGMIIVLVSSVIINYYVYHSTRKNIFSEAEKRARLLSESTALSFTNTLLYEEIGLVEEGGLLENQISDLLKNSDTELIEMTVLDPKGYPIAASDFSWYGKQRTEFYSDNFRRVDGTNLNYTEHSDLNALEVIIPLRIHGKRFGTLIAYFSLEKEYRLLAALRDRLLFLSIVGLVGAFGVAFIVARILANPIKRLAGEMVKVGDPQYRSKLVSKRRDEIGQMEKGFLKMLDRLRQAALEKERSQQALIQSEKMAALGTLVAGLAHEINNPLSGAMNCLRRIQSHPENVKQTKKYAVLMNSSLMRIGNLVGGLLQFSRKRETTLQPIDINLIIGQSVNLLNYRFGKNNILFKEELTSELPAIWGDKEQLVQVFINLMLNSIDAMPEGGELRVRSFSSDGTITVEISDAGIGIKEENLTKIFDPFYTSKEVGKGTGLGLAVSKSIMDNHKGTIEVKSGLGEGTTFTLNFPVMVATGGDTCSISVAILAGGKSFRMGENKALLKVDGETLIQRAVNAAQSCVIKPIIITNAPEELSFLGLPLYPDMIKGAGPLGGIFTALKISTMSHCLILACDLPFVSDELIEFLCEDGVAYDVVAVDAGNGVEPLCAVYSKACLPAIEKQLGTGNYRVTDFYSEVNVKVHHPQQGRQIFTPEMFFNINTPDDIKRAQKINTSKRR